MILTQDIDFIGCKHCGCSSRIDVLEEPNSRYYGRKHCTDCDAKLEVILFPDQTTSLQLWRRLLEPGSYNQWYSRQDSYFLGTLDRVHWYTLYDYYRTRRIYRASIERINIFWSRPDI